MAKFGYYKQSPTKQGSILIEEYEGTGMSEIKNTENESVKIYRDFPNGTRHPVAIIHLNRGEWVKMIEE